MDKFLTRENANDEPHENENNKSNLPLSSKRKKREYQESYLQYGFISSEKDSFLQFCLICLKTLSNETMNSSKLRRHLETNIKRRLRIPSVILKI